MHCCAIRCAPRRAGGPSPAWPSSTPNRSRPSQKGQRGYDAGKRVKERKRRIDVDAMGLLLVVVVHSADIQDRMGARALLVRLFMHLSAEHVWLGRADDQALPAAHLHGRWIVQRTFVWLSQSRRLSKNYAVTALFSRCIREDRLHSAHGQTFWMILRINFSRRYAPLPPKQSPRPRTT